MAETMKLDDAGELDFDRATVEQAYDRWAPIYDLVFGGVFSKGRKAAIQATNKIGGRVLEVGVGTGISLPLYLGAIVSPSLSLTLLRSFAEHRAAPDPRHRTAIVEAHPALRPRRRRRTAALRQSLLSFEPQRRSRSNKCTTRHEPTPRESAAPAGLQRVFYGGPAPRR